MAWARQLGRRIGEELGIPVYLYGAAATRRERVRLADVRRGEYEGLKEAIARPERHPRLEVLEDRLRLLASSTPADGLEVVPGGVHFRRLTAYRGGEELVSEPVL